jgi:transketolase
MQASSNLDTTCINTIRTLSMDAVEAANSGHPGAPMAMAPIAYCLWQQFLRFDPQDPIWPNRDRFVFDDQPEDYRDRVLPPAVTARVSLEQASTFGWSKYVGATGHSIGMRSFGASAPLKDLARKFGFTPEHVVAAAREQLKKSRG